MNLPTKTVLFGALALAASMSTAVAGNPIQEQDQDWRFMNTQPSSVVQAVREATARYQDASDDELTAAGYGKALGCVSSPDDGVMGVHYVNGAYLTDGKVDVGQPAALVYEPLRNGRKRLVAVEYIVFAQGWDDPANTDHAPGPPKLMGQLFDYMGAPNRFGLPNAYTLHVWAWRYNPKGTFAMWNPRASCDAYTE